MALTVWVLLVVPMLVLPLGFAILNGPSLARTFAGSLRAQLHAAVTQLGHADIAAGLLTVISTVLLVLPMAGLSYILLRTVKSTFRQVLAVTRRRPALRLLAVAVTLLVAAGLAAHWGVLPSRGRGAALRPSQAGRVTVERPDLAPPAAGRPAGRSCSSRSARPGSTRWKACGEPGNENGAAERDAIDGDPGYRLADPVLSRQPGPRRPEEGIRSAG